MTGGGSPFLRFSRDKRGYEHFYLVQQATRRGRPKARILYWFRTPPNVKVGRVPFDDEVRREIEARNPGVTFDWKRLLDTPIPPPPADVERWRERRRAQRAARSAGPAGGPARSDEAPETPFEDETPEPDVLEAPQTIAVGDLAVAASAEAAVEAAAAPAGEQAQEGQGGRRRRRRRGGRRRHAASAAAPQGPAEAVEAGETDESGDAHLTVDSDESGEVE
ncbi:MAG: hypothetical protein ACM3SQ_09030 [Betaproteobacteria bacterium]